MCDEKIFYHQNKIKIKNYINLEIYFTELVKIISKLIFKQKKNYNILDFKNPNINSNI